MLDFSHRMYKNLVLFFLDGDYNFLTFNQYLRLENFKRPAIILRHDVDRFPNKALKLASLERDNGIISTYFFRSHMLSFSDKIISSIANMGHEIGYHYEDLCNTNGDIELAWSHFRQNINKLRKIVPVCSISMHGRPFSKWDSHILWKHKNYKEMGLFDVSLDIDWSNFRYFTDVGRRWNGGLNRRDKVNNMINLNGCSTTELLVYLTKNSFENLVISMHPERWSSSYYSWIGSFGIDFVVSKIKKHFLFGAKADTEA